MSVDLDNDPYCPACGQYMPLTIYGDCRVHDCDRTPPVGDVVPNIYVCPECGGHGTFRFGCWGTENNPHEHEFARPVHELVQELRNRKPINLDDETSVVNFVKDAYGLLPGQVPRYEMGDKTQEALRRVRDWIRMAESDALNEDPRRG